MEREAYERARKFDTETISRQDTEIDELRAQNREQGAKILVLEQENAELNRKYRRLLQKIFELENRVIDKDSEEN